MLGFNYIWIDSLCILQDSDSDWAEQSGMMTRIYGNAFCTLAAESSREAQTGTIFPRSPRSVSYIKKIDMRWQGKEGCWLITDFDKFNETLCSTALSRRGWALQEALMSKRILHMYEHEWGWTCQSGYACETFPNGLPSWLRDSQDWWRHKSTGHLRLEYSMASSDRMKSLWAEIIENYTRRMFTKSTDKLVALWGIIEDIQRGTGDKCLGGIWKTKALDQLCWGAMLSIGEYPSRTGIAPSWSWASIDAPITLTPFTPPVKEIEADYNARLVEISTSNQIATRDGNKTVETKGVVLLNARVARVQIHSSEYLERFQTSMAFELVVGRNNALKSTNQLVYTDSEADADKLIQNAFLVPIRKDYGERSYGLLIYKSVKDGVAAWVRGGLAVKHHTASGQNGNDGVKWHSDLKRACDFFDSSEERKEFEQFTIDGRKEYVVEIH